MALSSPIGTEMRVAMPVTSRVPVMACRMPPPSPTTLRIEEVKNVGVMKAGRPLSAVVTMIETRGTRAMMNAAVTRAVIRRSLAWRAPSTM